MFKKGYKILCVHVLRVMVEVVVLRENLVTALVHIFIMAAEFAMYLRSRPKFCGFKDLF